MVLMLMRHRDGTNRCAADCVCHFCKQPGVLDIHEFVVMYPKAEADTPRFFNARNAHFEHNREVRHGCCRTC